MLMPRAIPPFGLLLCGGRSSRMGQDKALLTLDGERLLDRGLRLLREAGCRQVWAAGDYAGVPCLPDAPVWQGRGPLAGIAAALAYAPQASWLVIPVDMPGLESDFLRRFLQRAQQYHPQEYPQQYPQGAWMQESQFPLWLAHPAAASTLHRLLSAADPRVASVGALLQALALAPLPAAALLAADQPARALCNTLCNTNTPAEWQQFCHPAAEFDDAAYGAVTPFAV